MTKAPKKGSEGAPTKASKEADSGREERLAAALRENLRRRKAQARGREAPKAAPEAETGGQKRDSGRPES
jgi:hypothetical protein